MDDREDLIALHPDNQVIKSLRDFIEGGLSSGRLRRSKKIPLQSSLDKRGGDERRKWLKVLSTIEGINVKEGKNEKIYIVSNDKHHSYGSRIWLHSIFCR